MKNLINGLYIVATPIGNLGDLSNRAKEVLNMVDIIICENRIHSLKLLNNLGIKKKMLTLHDYNEKRLIKNIEKFQYNSSIALISDAGSPLISDPGYRLVLDYIKKDIMITPIPGPSSVIAALQLSGFQINNFIFFGFVPKINSSINSLIKKINKLESTSVLFISGLRLRGFLENLLKNRMYRQISVCKEMTKKNENIFRGNAQDIVDKLSMSVKNIKGEFVVVIQGGEKKPSKTIEGSAKTQIKKLLEKFSLTDVVEIVHKLSSISKKEIYKIALLIKND